MSINPSSRNLRDLPPRRVDIFTKATILFSGIFQLFGWVFFTMGSLFAWIFLPASTVKYWFEKEQNWKKTPGVVLHVEPTNSTVNDRMIYRCLHLIDVDGKTYTGKSFTAGQAYAAGDTVAILYAAENPLSAYIEGTERAVFPAFVLFVLIFPVVGAGFIFSSLRQNLKALRLLQIGASTRGKLVSKDPTNMMVKMNGTQYPVFKFSFEFEAGGGKHIATCKTHQTWKVEDEEREIVLYDQFNPGFNLVYDAAPNMPAISAEGMLEAAPAWKVVYLLLPAVGIGLNVYFFMQPPALIQ